MSKKTNYIVIQGKLLNDTKDAYLFAVDNIIKVWFPRSVAIWKDNKFSVQEWFLEKKDLL